ncbi:MAG: CRISPR-associated endonuclease Cas2 [Paenibacillaceae bacterium]|nr:CRISPR-associated endonuclease Cas2 [Paenibacillaceae bacterium]
MWVKKSLGGGSLTKLELSQLIDQEKDNLRFYRLGNNYKIKVEHMGAKPSLDLEDPLIF